MTYIHPDDPYGMDWTAGNAAWGTVRTINGIQAERQTSAPAADGTITERHTCTNTTQKRITTTLTDLAIYAPFNDDYTSAAVFPDACRQPYAVYCCILAGRRSLLCNCHALSGAVCSTQKRRYDGRI